MTKTSDFNYILPPELNAQTPVEPRDSSRLLVYERAADKIMHTCFSRVVDYLKKGDVLVLNNTRVLPARIFGNKPSGGKVELLLLSRIDNSTWRCLAKPGKNALTGAQILFSEGLSATVTGEEDDGVRVVRFDFSGSVETILDRIGTMPLPPYIKEKLADQTRYNTVYSRVDGSAAAPTAGLHFTPQLLDQIRALGVTTAEVLLHVGLGTFRPVKSDEVEAHHMHAEYYSILPAEAEKINAARANGGGIIAVGTTSVRALESAADDSGRVNAGNGQTKIFIYPSYKFKAVDALITNFHLPQSTLLMLVSAFAGREKTLALYNAAVAEKYRFFSFGDAMLLL